MIDVSIPSLRLTGADGAAREVLRDLSFALGEGEFVCLTGPSGCGKTTTLRAMMGLEGDAAVREELRLAAVFQEPRLLPWRSVRRNVELAAEVAGAGADIVALLASVGLADHADDYPAALSGGLARRAALARALAVSPDLLLLDEPFVSLDAQAADRLRDLLSSLWAERRFTVLMVTHDLEEALRLSDRILVMDRTPGPLRGEFAMQAARGARDLSALKAAFAERFSG